MGRSDATDEERHLRKNLPSGSARFVAEEASSATAAVVIPTYNRAAFLREALQSVFAQTRPADEVIVVDDGSDDDPAEVVAEFPGVIFLRQDNSGPSEARNAGIRAANSDYVLCLDSDDVLMPTALETSLACMADNPGAAFVYGGHLRVDEALEPIDRPFYSQAPLQPYHKLLQENFVYMLGTVLFDRAKLLAVGGFDPRLSRSEDYDLFLRLARNHPIASDPAIIALYRIHGANLSARTDEMLAAALAIRERHRPDSSDTAGMRAYRRGKWMLVRTFAIGAWREGPHASRSRKWKERLEMARIAPFSSLAAAGWQLVRRRMPKPLRERLKRIFSRQVPPIGRVQLGDLGRTRPISRHFGYDRGTPIDRYYIEKFLTSHAADIKGRLLEVGDAGYSRRFGSNVVQQDILHVTDDTGETTIVGDLSQAGTLPSAAFDCMIIVQTLQYIFDLSAALHELWSGLRLGGVALVTLPGVATADNSEFTQYWSFTEPGALRLFADVFGADNVEVELFGNVFAATCFLQGLAAEEVEPSMLDKTDPRFPTLIAVRARRGS